MTMPGARPKPRWTSGDAELAPPPRRASVAIEELDDEALLCDLRTGQTHRLNQVALHIWRRCDGMTTTRQIAEELAEVYEVTPEVVLDDVEQLVLALADADLFESAES